jgi:hypothetical protein
MIMLIWRHADMLDDMTQYKTAQQGTGKSHEERKKLEMK